jgi:dCMP deaminase
MMATAYQFEPLSTCDRNHVGAVIAREGRIISTGYNGAPAGMPHCVHTETGTVTHPDGTVITSRRVSPIQLLPSAPLDRGCKLAIHAEANAISYAARNGVAVDGGTAYVTLSPCYACAQLMIAAGLKRVVYDRSYRDPAGIDLLRSAGLAVYKA